MPVTIKGKSYRTVWERLNAAHTSDSLEPKGIKVIHTEVVATAPLLIVRATVEFDGGRQFSGLSEAKLDAPPNSADGTNPVECAETSALGRALAFAGYYGNEDGIAGAEEMRQASPPTSATNVAAHDNAEQERLAKARAWYQRHVKLAQEHGVEYVPLKQLVNLEAIVSEGKALRHKLDGVLPKEPIAP